MTIVVALHAFAFVVKAPRDLRRCNNVGCGSWNQLSLAVIVFCFIAEFIYLLAFAFPNYVCPVVPREEPPTIPDTSDKVRAIYRPMAAWYQAPARDALRRHHGAFPPTSAALLAWKSFDAVTTEFLVDQGAAARV